MGQALFGAEYHVINLGFKLNNYLDPSQYHINMIPPEKTKIMTLRI